jgi:uncharacterized protein YcfJ
MEKIAYALSTLFVAAAPAFAGDTFTDRAKVLAVSPINERIPVSREQCWNEKVRSYEERRVTRSDTGAAIGPGTVLGAIVGGVAGHQVGSGRGNDAATAAGAVIGGLVGNQVDRGNSGGTTTHVERVPVDRNVERCRTVQEVREARVGYDVRYAYNGREFRTRMDRDPGRFLEVAVNIEPREGQEIAPRGHRPPPPTYR